MSMSDYIKTRYTPKNWGEMTKAERRVAIAEDALAQIHARKVIPGTGAYVRKLRVVVAGEACGHLDFADNYGKIKECDACALGCMFISHVRFFDGRSIGGMSGIGDESIYGILGEHFDQEQLWAIEVAFEGHIMSWMPWWDTAYDTMMDYPLKDIPAAIRPAFRFYRKLAKHEYNAEDRLVVILQNIIDHEGTFRPEVDYEVAEVYA